MCRGKWFQGENCIDVDCPQPYTAGGCDLNENADFQCVCFVDGDDTVTDCNGGIQTTPLTLGQSICGTASIFIDSAGSLVRDLDWWHNPAFKTGGTFTFAIGAHSTCLILLVNFNSGTVDHAAGHDAGYFNTTTLTLEPSYWGVLSTASEWNTDWICGSGLETYTLLVE